jgi:hypothetical protein
MNFKSVIVGTVMFVAAGVVSAQAIYGPQGQYRGYIQTSPSGVTTTYSATGQVTGSFQTDRGQTNFYSPQGVYQGTATAPIYAVPNTTIDTPRQVPQVPQMRGW